MVRSKVAKRKRLTGPIHGNIRELREGKGWTQQQLAERIGRKADRPGLDKTAVSHWETGIARPDIDLLPFLARELSTTVDELLSKRKRAA